MSMEVTGPAEMDQDGVYENVTITETRDGVATTTTGNTVTLTTDEHGGRNFDVRPADVPGLRVLGAYLSLTDFLVARIDEDEQEASAIDRGTDWYLERPGWQDVGVETRLVGRGKGLATFDGDYDVSEHVLRWNPERVLAECVAKRSIVDRHAEDGCEYCPEVSDECPTLRALASVYATHSDYRTGWSLGGLGAPRAHGASEPG